MIIGEYNTSRPGIKLKEYGRNVQKLVDHIRNTPDKDKRTELAYTLIELIKQLTPTLKDQPENPQRLWDDLYIIADFNLDVNNPYPVPEPEVIFKKPMRVAYPQSEVRYKHYGKNLERLVKEALKLTDPQEREDAIIYLGKLMKTFYGNWNKETLDDSVIIKDLKILSGGALSMDIEKVREDNLFEKLYRERKKPNTRDGQERQGNSQSGSNGNSGNNNNSNNNKNNSNNRNQGNRPYNKNRHNNNQHRRRDS
jgi:Domain of unknown function (DUF4290)